VQPRVRKQLHHPLDAIATLVEPVESHFIRRPQLRDPSDEMTLQAAINGAAKAIVTFNSRDFGLAPDEGISMNQFVATAVAE
jgi:predicted nucleic acid-binding protein